MNLPVENAIANGSKAMAAGLVGQLSLIDVRKVDIVGKFITSFNYQSIMKDRMVSLELQIKIAAVTGERYLDPVIVITE